MQGADRQWVEAATTGDLSALDLPKKEMALMNFVHLLTVNSHKNTPVEIRKLREAGWSDNEIQESVLIVGMFSMFNRVADAFGLEDPNYFEREKSGDAIIPATKTS